MKTPINRIIYYRNKKVKVVEKAFFDQSYWVVAKEPIGKIKTGERFLVSYNTVEKYLGLPLTKPTRQVLPDQNYFPAVKSKGIVYLISGKAIGRELATIVAEAQSKNNNYVLTFCKD